MQHLIDILEHPYLILNRIAEAIYEESNEAVFQKLRDRAKKRHRFTVEDYKALKKSLLGFSRQLERLATKMEKNLSSKKNIPVSWYELMSHNWIKRKPVLIAVGKRFDLTYDKIYDGMRGKSAVIQKNLIQEIISEYQQFSQWIREELEKAEADKMNYNFSEGRGGGSHKKDEKQ